MINLLLEITGFSTKELLICIISWLYVIAIFVSIHDFLERISKNNE